MGDKVHSYGSNCIYSVANLIGTLSQKVTYLFVIGALELEWFKNAKFRQ